MADLENVEIIPDAGCDYECMIWEPHRHMTIIDTTPPSDLDRELTRMKQALSRERIKAGERGSGIVGALFDLSPEETPFLAHFGFHPDREAAAAETRREVPA